MKLKRVKGGERNLNPLEIHVVSIDDLTILLGTTHTRVEQVMRSIKEIGMRQPIKVDYYEGDGTYHLRNGHHRVEVCRRLGIKKIPAYIEMKEGEFPG